MVLMGNTLKIIENEGDDNGFDASKKKKVSKGNDYQRSDGIKTRYMEIESLTLYKAIEKRGSYEFVR